jgi:hypothetical protein
VSRPRVINLHQAALAQLKHDLATFYDQGQPK